MDKTPSVSFESSASSLAGGSGSLIDDTTMMAPEGFKVVVPDEIDDVLSNPGKGWAIHYYDDSLVKYGSRLGGDMLHDFPGFEVVYLRLAWSYLEPREGKFNWEVIDGPIARWSAAGKKAAFRITCCESAADQKFATPEWVREAGAAGYFFGQGNWEPDYGDGVFMRKLENFLEAFAARYDGRDEIAFIDIGSYGIWGEWHTSASTKRSWPVEVKKTHVDLYSKYFRKSRLIMIYGGGRQVCDYAREKAGAGLRTDSVGVYSFFVKYGGHWSWEIDPKRDAGSFENTWREHPVVIEPAHYEHALRYNTWQKGSTLERAVEDLHASWVTVHHWPREWLEENRGLAARLANRMGYWFILKTVIYPSIVRRNSVFPIQMNWENRGVAPIYRNYPPAVSLQNIRGEEVLRLVLQEDIRRFMPGKVSFMVKDLKMPPSLAPGEYALRVGMVEDADSGPASLRLGIEGIEDDFFYRIGKINVV